MLILMSIWFLVSFVFGILLVDMLNQIQFFGFKLGFWWAQQGSIYVFIILIFTYVIHKTFIYFYNIYWEFFEIFEGWKPRTKII